MTSAIVRKLSIFADLTKADQTALDAACTDVRSVSAKRDIIAQGDCPDHIHAVVEGWAARYNSVEDGRKQITAFLLPGDFLDLHATVLGRTDHSARAITRCKVAYLKHEVFEALLQNSSSLARAFWWSTLVDEATLRSWVVSLGRRDAYGRIAHLLCELRARLALVGLVRGDHFDLPLTQEEIADATGLTPVHTNRTLQRLRGDGLIELSRSVLTVPDVNALRQAAGFDASFFHVEHRVR